MLKKKLCPWCNTEKIIGVRHWQRNARSSDGFSSVCSECRNARRAAQKSHAARAPDEAPEFAHGDVWEYDDDGTRRRVTILSLSRSPGWAGLRVFCRDGRRLRTVSVAVLRATGRKVASPAAPHSTKPPARAEAAS